MRNKILMAAAAALVLTSAGMASGVALAQVQPSEIKKDSEIKNPAKADAAVSKDEAKSAKKYAHRARKKAKVAAKDADAAAKAAAH